MGGWGGGGWGVIHQISTLHGLKNGRFESNWSKIARPVAAIKSLRFALFIYLLLIIITINTMFYITC